MSKICLKLMKCGFWQRVCGAFLESFPEILQFFLESGKALQKCPESENVCPSPFNCPRGLWMSPSIVVDWQDTRRISPFSLQILCFLTCYVSSYCCCSLKVCQESYVIQLLDTGKRSGKIII